MAISCLTADVHEYKTYKGGETMRVKVRSV